MNAPSFTLNNSIFEILIKVIKVKTVLINKLYVQKLESTKWASKVLNSSVAENIEDNMARKKMAVLEMSEEKSFSFLWKKK